MTGLNWWDAGLCKNISTMIYRTHGLPERTKRAVGRLAGLTRDDRNGKGAP